MRVRKQTLLNLTILITCAGIAVGFQDTLTYGDYRSFVLDVWILAAIIGYWLLYSVSRPKSRIRVRWFILG